MRGRLPADVVWLLDVTIGRRLHRYSTRPLEVSSASGDVLTYLGGLSDIAASRGQDQIPVQVIDPAQDWEALLIAGEHLDGARAELRRLVVGDTIEQAEVYAGGWLSAPTVGVPGLTTGWSASISSGSPRSRQVPTSADSSTGWPSTVTVDDAAQGAYAPMVIGAPGRSLYSAWPGVYCESAGTKYVMVARVAGAQDPTGSTINIWDTTSGAYERRECNLSVIAGTGAIFADVSTPIDGAWTTAPTFGRAYHVGVRRGTTISAISVTGGAALTAGDVLAHMAQRHIASGWDVLAQLHQRDRLSGYEIDAVINTPVDAWAWIRSVLIPILPIVPRVALGGVYMAAMRLTASPADSVASLVGGRDIERASGIEVSNTIFNDFTLKYSPSRGGSQYLRVHRITGDPEQEDLLSSTHAHRLCRDSARAYGHRPMPPISTRAVWSDATAALILGQMAMRHALPWHQVEYIAGPALEWLREDDVVTITDGAFVGRLALVGPVVVGAGATRFSVRFFPLSLVRQ